MITLFPSSNALNLRLLKLNSYKKCITILEMDINSNDSTNIKS